MSRKTGTGLGTPLASGGAMTSLPRLLFSEAGRMIRSRIGLGARPWMRNREVDLLLDVLALLAPRKCLEIGCGFSTLFLPRSLSPDTSWRALETDSAWQVRIRGKATRQGTTVELVGDSPAEILEAAHRGAPYEFLLIDGGPRRQLIESSDGLVSEDGLVLVHDANRPGYRESAIPFDHRESILDYRRNLPRGDGGFLVMGKWNFSAAFDVEKHQAVFRCLERAGPLLSRLGVTI